MGERTVGMVVALALEALILLLLLTLGQTYSAPQERGPALTTFDASSSQEEQAPAAEPAPEQDAAPETPREVAEQVPEPIVVETQPSVAPIPLPRPDPIILTPPVAPAPAAPAATPPPARPRAVLGPVQGPPAGPADRAGAQDTATVGTAPDGTPLYAAAWYREPADGELAGYLSTASGPGWGLIACRTAPEWRVEECVALDESPRGSNIARSVLAAAWQFKVRPPRVGGRSLVGSWVRIRIDYGIRPR